MRNISVPIHTDRLRSLADRFDHFRSELANTAPLTGTEGLRQLTRHLRTSHELTVEALTRLTAIDGSQVTQMTGALAALDCLAQTVQHSGHVSDSLTTAVAANAYEGTPWDPAKDADVIGRGLRHMDARNAIAAHFDDATASLAICAEGCLVVADHLANAFPGPDRTQARAADNAVTASRVPAAVNLSAPAGIRR
ncbi:hypothetical protein [Streptomyces sp. H34-S4]|uniref:hypothetical protein n=1 Tax=Streptomyces sp. H34-S4 TaxID=2996463 RepID=UPI0022710B50|nr:hypothetical protein [Streptomyces sp. H34-S4]MCY0933844.1 hypothetical protein [Streptomyces sp. H34-S4]